MKKIPQTCSSHRTNWNKPDCNIGNEQMALSRPYSMTHGQ